MMTDLRFLSFYELIAWAMMIMLYSIFVVSVFTDFLPTSYALLALGSSVASGYSVLQIRRLQSYRRQKEHDQLAPSRKRRAYPPLSRVLFESGVVAAITLATAFGADSLAVVLVVYLVGIAAIAIIEGIFVVRRRMG
jgi:hypothetical protein